MNTRIAPPRAMRLRWPSALLGVLLALGSIPSALAQEAWQPATFCSSLNEETLELSLPGKQGSPGFSFARQPLAFERNDGQTDASVAFLARGRGYTLFLAKEEAVLRLHTAEVLVDHHDLEMAGCNNSPVGDGPVGKPALLDSKPPQVLRMRLVGANPQAIIEGEDGLCAKVNYFIGNQPSLWRTHIPTFGKVRYREVYPGIDLVYYGNEGQLEYDFVVAPGANPNQIAMEFEGADEMHVDERGDLLLKLGDREVRWQRPFIFQEVNGARHEIAGAYRILEDGRTGNTPLAKNQSLHYASFELAAYDRAVPLVIDPRLVYATYLGGSGVDRGRGLGLDESGNIYVAGATASIDFPVQEALMSQHAGGDRDVFISKFSSSGELLFSTYLGGSGDDDFQGAGRMAFAVSGSGDCYVVGTTTSWDFPLLEAVQGGFGGGENDAFVTGLEADGSALLFSTYLGGEDFEAAWAVALGPEGDIYVGGHTRSAGFPSLNGFQPQISAPYNGEVLQEGFITRLKAGGKGMVYSTFYGVSSRWERVHDVAVDAEGSAYVAVQVHPWEGAIYWLVSKIRSDGGSRLFERRWPISGQASVGSPRLALGQNDTVVVAGSVYAFGAFSLPAINKPNASTTQGYSDTYILQLSATNGTYRSAVYLGGSGNDGPNDVLVDKAGDIVVVGSTAGPEYQASGFPVTDPMESGPDAGKSGDVFVAKFRAADLSLAFSTLIGGPLNDDPGGYNGSGAALDPDGNLCIAGVTGGQFPTANAFQPIHAGESDAFLVKLSFGEKLQVSRSGQTLRLSWPASATGFVLESAGSIQGGNWTEVATPPVVEGDQNVVTVEIGSGSQFFRLRGP